MKVKLPILRFKAKGETTDLATLDPDIITAMPINLTKGTACAWTMMIPRGLDTSKHVDVKITHSGIDGNHHLEFAWDLSEYSGDDRVFLFYTYNGEDPRVILKIEAEGECR